LKFKLFQGVIPFTQNKHCINFLLQNTKQAVYLKNNCTFAPMNNISVHITSISRTNRPTASPEVRIL
jgi:hypothetical protein